MTEDRIVQLFKDTFPGSAVLLVTPVSGGYLHRMYRVDTQNGPFAVKRLDPNIMQRPGALDNFRRADALEEVLEDAGIPIVPAIRIGGSKLQAYDGAYFYIYRWQKGEVADPRHISAEQCRMAGSIQGRIHAIAPARVPETEPVSHQIDWSEYIQAAAAINADIGTLLQENEALLIHAQNEMNRARAALPGIECIVDEDMDPKNVMWDEGKPVVIDLECLERGNPVSGALQLSLQWAGASICDLDLTKLKAFFDGYLAAYDNGFRAYSAVFGLAYTWIEWLEYNVRRVIEPWAGEAERKLGISEVRLTVDRIRYLYAMEDSIKQQLDLWFRPSF